jgi:hypothetical protein
MVRAFPTESAHQFEVQALQQVQSVFLANPSVANAREFCSLLIDASESFDSLTLLLKSMAPHKQCFYTVFLIVQKYYDALPVADGERFNATFQATKNMLPSKARVLCLEAMMRRNRDYAFFLALADCDDEELLAKIKEKWDTQIVEES